VQDDVLRLVLNGVLEQQYDLIKDAERENVNQQ